MSKLNARITQVATDAHDSMGRSAFLGPSADVRYSRIGDITGSLGELTGRHYHDAHLQCT